MSLSITTIDGHVERAQIRTSGTTWKRSAMMSQSVGCGTAVVTEWYASITNHDTV